MADVGTLKVRIDADTAGLQAGISRAQAAVQRAGARMQGVGRGMSSVGKTMSLAVTAPLAIMGKMGVDELGEIQAANAQTEAAIKRLGSGVQVTTKSIQEQAAALQKLSGFDDQAIQSAQNMLLTQGNLDVKTKRGARAFKAASRVMIDYAAATKKEPTAAAKALAKALADPENGLKKMTKEAGFTKKEVEQLTKRMEGVNDPALKQGMLIDALGKKYSGAGAAAGSTLASKLAVVKDQLAGVAATIVSYAIPYVEKFAGWLTQLMAKFEALSPKTKKWVAIAVGIGAVLGPVLVVVGTLVTALGAVVGALGAIGAPALAIIAAIAAVGVAFVLAYRRSESFRNGVNSTVRQIAATVKPVLKDIRKTLNQWGAWIRAFWAAHGAQIMATIRATWARIAPMIKTWMNQAAAAIRLVLAVMRGDWSSAWRRFKEIANLSGQQLKQAVRALMAAIAAIIRGAGKLYAAAFRAAIRTGVNAAKRAFGDAKTAVGNKVDELVNSVGAKMSGLAGKFTAAGNAAKAAFVSALSAIPAAIRGIHLPSIDIKMKKYKIPKGPTVSIPSGISWHARGGIVNGAQVVGVGEAGPEAIVPLGSGRRASMDRARVMRNAGMGGGGITIHNLTVNANDANGGRVAARAFLDEMRRQAPAATFAGNKLRMG